MGNSPSIYNKLTPDFQREINELYKSYNCRYNYLEQKRKQQHLVPADKEHLELLHILNNFKSAHNLKSKVHEDNTLEDIIPPNVKETLDSECTQEQKETPVDIKTLIIKRDNIAEKIKDAIKAINSGLHEMHIVNTEGGSKKSKKSKNHRSKKHRSRC
jgi:hypothetical protein